MPDDSTESLGAALELFIYYRSRPEDSEALGVAVRAMQQRLQSDCPGLGARWLRRPELREGCTTWMEVYALPAGLTGEAAENLVAVVEQAARSLAPWQVGERKVERFLDLTLTPRPSVAAPPQGGA